MENVKNFWELINKDRRQAIHELTDTIVISYGVCQEILTGNLNMLHIAPSQKHALLHIPENQSLWLTATWSSFSILPTHRT
jgi:hypothetical protein